MEFVPRVMSTVSFLLGVPLAVDRPLPGGGYRGDNLVQAWGIVQGWGILCFLGIFLFALLVGI